MRAAFGKVNRLHNHVLPWADRPLVINNLVGGEDGIDDAGVSVARLIPNPGCFSKRPDRCFAATRATSPLYQTSQRGQLSYVGHLRGYQDLSESTNIDLGVSCVARLQRRRVVAGHRRLDDESAAASTRPCGGSRCGGRFTTRSSAARK